MARLVAATPGDAVDVLSACRAVVGVDTGLTHIAAQQGTPTSPFVDCRRSISGTGTTPAWWRDPMRSGVSAGRKEVRLQPAGTGGRGFARRHGSVPQKLAAWTQSRPVSVFAGAA